MYMIGNGTYRLRFTPNAMNKSLPGSVDFVQTSQETSSDYWYLHTDNTIRPYLNTNACLVLKGAVSAPSKVNLEIQFLTVENTYVQKIYIYLTHTIGTKTYPAVRIDSLDGQTTNIQVTRESRVSPSYFYVLSRVNALIPPLNISSTTPSPCSNSLKLEFLTNADVFQPTLEDTFSKSLKTQTNQVFIVSPIFNLTLPNRTITLLHDTEPYCFMINLLVSNEPMKMYKYDETTASIVDALSANATSVLPTLQQLRIPLFSYSDYTFCGCYEHEAPNLRMDPTPMLSTNEGVKSWEQCASTNPNYFGLGSYWFRSSESEIDDNSSFCRTGSSLNNRTVIYNISRNEQELALTLNHYNLNWSMCKKDSANRYHGGSHVLALYAKSCPLIPAYKDMQPSIPESQRSPFLVVIRSTHDADTTYNTSITTNFTSITRLDNGLYEMQNGTNLICYSLTTQEVSLNAPEVVKMNSSLLTHVRILKTQSNAFMFVFNDTDRGTLKLVTNELKTNTTLSNPILLTQNVTTIRTFWNISNASLDRSLVNVWVRLTINPNQAVFQQKLALVIVTNLKFEAVVFNTIDPIPNSNCFYHIKQKSSNTTIADLYITCGMTLGQAALSSSPTKGDDLTPSSSSVWRIFKVSNDAYHLQSGDANISGYIKVQPAILSYKLRTTPTPLGTCMRNDLSPNPPTRQITCLNTDNTFFNTNYTINDLDCYLQSCTNKCDNAIYSTKHVKIWF
jgi:hypothetical protein